MTVQYVQLSWQGVTVIFHCWVFRSERECTVGLHVVHSSCELHSWSKATIITSPLFGVRGIAFSVSVCLFVFLSHFSTTTCPNFITFSLGLHVTCRCGCVSADGSAIRYVLPVLWMTSFFHVIERLSQNRRRRVCFVQFAMWRHR